MSSLLPVLVGALTVSAAFEVYLIRRQIGHVAAHRAAVPADFAAAIDIESHQKAADYTTARCRFELVEKAWAFVFLMVLLLGGLDTLYGAVASTTPDGLTRSLAFVAALTLIQAVLRIPFSAYKTFAIEGKFGFNTMTVGLFIADTVKSTILAMLLVMPLLAGLLWLMNQVSGAWWVYAWLGLMVFAAAMAVIVPTVIMPLFNKFSPLPEGDLRGRLEALLGRCGFTAKGLFVVDGSKRSRHGNAYFTGFGAAKRIVLYDTLIASQTPEEIEAVLAHEVGHAKHRHILWSFLRMAVMTFVYFFAFDQIATNPQFLAAFGIQHADPILALMLFSYCTEPLSLLTTPFSNWLSRRAEFQADAYASQTVGAAPLISGLVKLYKDNAATLTPDPLYSLVHHSHPPAAIRIAALRGAASPA